ncbi:nuclear transport factor 2 family protein [Rheinheimera sp.]|uniref:nuclear transport factor 2 family protein n=1 Tax=Rheinheimera sp. TaxID=1869214 RepID=UPI002734F8BE|nr:nuclear transport factor 2 family protein [Rheinheimera sp.]MDP2716423.1 nuclear transport factor 2 family protein [Rheinheimera sp.]
MTISAAIAWFIAGVTRDLGVAVSLCAALMVMPAAAAQTPAQITGQNRQLVSQAFTDWADGGSSFFTDMLAPDVVWTIKGSGPAAGSYHGRDDFINRAVKPFTERMAGPLKPTVRDIWAQGNDVIIHWDGTGTAKDGLPYHNSYVWIFRMKGLQATEVIAFLDLSRYDELLNRVKPEAP